MKSYSLKYSTISSQIWVLVAVPILFTALLVLFFLTSRNYSDTIIISSVILVLILSIVVTLFLFFKHATINTTILLSLKGIEIKNESHSWFHHFTNKIIQFEELNQLTIDDDFYKENQKFIILKRKEDANIILSNIKKEGLQDFIEFIDELKDALSNYNMHLASNKKPVLTGSYYTGTFGKIMTIVCYILTPLFIAAFFFADLDSIQKFRIIWFISLASAWIINYHRVKKKEHSKK